MNESVRGDSKNEKNKNEKQRERAHEIDMNAVNNFVIFKNKRLFCEFKRFILPVYDDMSVAI